MNNCSSILSVNQTKTSVSIPRLKGLFQGSILSPLLFNLFIDPLAQTLSRQIPNVVSLLFADDIALKARNFNDAQEALDICNTWSIENHQKWGIAKCGVTLFKSLKEFPLLIGNDVLPVCNSYKYLGLPHSGSGILWNKYLESIYARTMAFIAALSPRKINWPLKTRLVLFKVFIRPCYEYCLPLLSLWITKTKNGLLKKLEELHNAGISFIFDTKRSKSVLESMSGIGPLSHRLTVLSGSLAYHLNSLNTDNPLKVFHNRYFVISHPESILVESFKNNFLIGFLKQKKESKRPLSWRGYTRKALKNAFCLYPGILTKYILVHSRSSNLMDQLLLQPLNISKKGIYWRSNRAFINRICTVCNTPFNRRHINDCQLFRLADAGPSIMESEDYLSDLTMMLDDFGSNFNYCILDHFLNRQQYDLFLELYDHLDHMLIKSNFTFSPQGFLRAVGPGASPGLEL